MKKISIVVQWIVIVVLGILLYRVFHGAEVPPDRDQAAWNNWSGFSIVSIAGVAARNEEAYPNARRLEAWLAALKNAGYHTIRPEDARAFLAGQVPLPEKALLVIFESGRKEAFIRATPILQRLGMSATIAMPTALTRQWGGFYLKEREIRRIAEMPHWSFASMGHAAINDVPTNAAGGQGHFLAQRACVGERQETPDEFQARILGDYAQSADLLQKAVGAPVDLYLYPYADAGAGKEADPRAAEWNLIGLRGHYQMAVVGAHNAFNGASADPFSLTRLRASGLWSPEELLAALAQDAPRFIPLESGMEAAAWFLEDGAVLQGPQVALAAGAQAWLRGTVDWADVDVTARWQRDASAVASLYARYAGRRSYVRVSVESRGLRLQEQTASHLQTLFWRPYQAQGEQAIRLRVRANRAWVWVNGEEFAANVPLTPATARGRVGFGSEQGPVQIMGFDARPLPVRYAFANHLADVPEPHREAVSAILPTWVGMHTDAAFDEASRQDLVRAAAAGIETIPMIGNADTFDEAAALEVADWMDRWRSAYGLQGLVRSVAVQGAGASLAAALRARGFQLVQVVAAGESAAVARRLSQAGFADRMIIRDATPAGAAALAQVLHYLPAWRVALAAPPLAGDGTNIMTAVGADFARGDP